MIFCGIHIFAVIFLIYVTSEQLLPQKSNNGAKSQDIASESEFNAAVICSQAGNCTCLYEKHGVTVKCASAGKDIDKIVLELPETTTHL